MSKPWSVNVTVVSTWGKHGRGSTGDGILSLLGKVRDPPHKHPVEGGGGHLPQPALHLSHRQVLEPHRPLQLPHLENKQSLNHLQSFFTGFLCKV